MDCEQGIAPTNWKKSRIPADLQRKIDVTVDGNSVNYGQRPRGLLFGCIRHSTGQRSPDR